LSLEIDLQRWRYPQQVHPFSLFSDVMPPQGRPREGDRIPQKNTVSYHQKHLKGGLTLHADAQLGVWQPEPSAGIGRNWRCANTSFASTGRKTL
jgi:hypothetical protein